MSFVGLKRTGGQGYADCCGPLTTGSSSSCVVFTSHLQAVLSSFKFSSCFSSQTAMEWGLLAGLLGFVSCWPGAVFSGWLLSVLDGEMGSMPVSEKLHAYPSPNPKLTLTCYQLTIGRGGGVCRYSVTPTQDMFVIHVYFKLKIISIGFCSFMLFFY